MQKGSRAFFYASKPGMRLRPVWTTIYDRPEFYWITKKAVKHKKRTGIKSKYPLFKMIFWQKSRSKFKKNQNFISSLEVWEKPSISKGIDSIYYFGCGGCYENTSRQPCLENTSHARPFFTKTCYTIFRKTTAAEPRSGNSTISYVFMIVLMGGCSFSVRSLIFC